MANKNYLSGLLTVALGVSIYLPIRISKAFLNVVNLTFYTYMEYNKLTTIYYLSLVFIAFGIGIIVMSFYEIIKLKLK